MRTNNGRMAARDARGAAASQRAFTLIEVMIVVAILGILASIAYPSYRDSVLRSRRAEAKSDLMELAQIQERRFSATNSYRDEGGGIPDLPFEQSPRSGTAHYTIRINTPDNGTFTLTATPQGGQTADTCGTLTLNQLGAKTPTTAGCW